MRKPILFCEDGSEIELPFKWEIWGLTVRPETPDMIRGREAAKAVLAAGGSAMDAALKHIEVTFDETARARMLAARAARPPAILTPDDAAHRTVVVMDGLPRRHPLPAMEEMP